MSPSHDHHQDPALTIIQSLAERERELGASIEQAGDEARSIVEQAASAAARTRDGAVAAVSRQAADHRQKMSDLTASILSERGAAARKEAERLRSAATSKLDIAVDAVIDTVLPERG